jgi:hypothetical protein
MMLKENDKPMVKERLAENAHNEWCEWMKTFLSRAEVNKNGSITLSKKTVEEWKALSEIAYVDLDKKHMDAVGKHADRIIQILFQEVLS